MTAWTALHAVITSSHHQNLSASEVGVECCVAHSLRTFLRVYCYARYISYVQYSIASLPGTTNLCLGPHTTSGFCDWHSS